MTAPLKLLFDENFGEPLVHALADFMAKYHEPVEICHLFVHVPDGTPDEIWIPRIKGVGWTVVSTDRGRRCGGRKLPDICFENQVKHILLSGMLHNAKHFEKIRAIVSAWSEIVLSIRSQSGLRYCLRYDIDHRFILEEWKTKTIGSSSGIARLKFSGKKRVRLAKRRTWKKEIIPPDQRLFLDDDGFARIEPPDGDSTVKGDR